MFDLGRHVDAHARAGSSGLLKAVRQAAGAVQVNGYYGQMVIGAGMGGLCR
jgi:hypothetical protein